MELRSSMLMLAFHQTIASLSDILVKTLPYINLLPFYDEVCFTTTAILARKQFRFAVEVNFEYFGTFCNVSDLMYIVYT